MTRHRVIAPLIAASFWVLVLLHESAISGHLRWFEAGVVLQSLVTLCWVVLALSDQADTPRHTVSGQSPRPAFIEDRLVTRDELPPLLPLDADA